tara:strand:- start:2248 stop:2631 length:384 start_codon:yes stop_codon:yes gene_type:complete
MSKFLNSLLFLAAILAIGLVLSGHKENFELMPDNFPSRLLLADSYPVKTPNGLNNAGNNQQYLLNPVEFAGDYKKSTNNKKYWETPCNGEATTPDVCHEIYGETNIKKDKVCQPGFDCRRIGFFCSN